MNRWMDKGKEEINETKTKGMAGWMDYKQRKEGKINKCMKGKEGEGLHGTKKQMKDGKTDRLMNARIGKRNEGKKGG